MEKILEKIFSNNFNIYELANEYYDIRTPFTGLTEPKITYDSWQYAIKHLPLSIFIIKDIKVNYVLHLPGDHYDMSPSENHYTFSGWSVYDGENTQCECVVKNSTCCEIHINLRDMYTDACEFISNLLLHIKFMELHPDDEIIVYKKGNCEKYNYCGAVLKSNVDITTMDDVINIIVLSSPPVYSVKFNNIDFSKADVFITNKFNSVYQSVVEYIVDFCGSNDFKVHIIQGATTQLCLMTTDHPDYVLDDIEVTNSYGGKYEDYDRYIAKLHKRGGYELWDEINRLNSKWYKYVKISNLSYGFILLNKVVKSDKMDPCFLTLLENINKDENCVILNIPYSFGSESYYIAKAIVKCFEDRLLSFQVIGKAGGIGDIKLNDYVIANKLSISYPDVFHIDPEKSVISLSTSDKINETLVSSNEVTIHKGGVKILPCVLFESKEYLESIMGDYCAIEMEGYWYSLIFNDLSILNAYLYYISDLPLLTSLAHENYPRDEGQVLFNGLIRMSFELINSSYYSQQLITKIGGSYILNVFKNIVNKKSNKKSNKKINRKTNKKVNKKINRKSNIKTNKRVNKKINKKINKKTNKKY